MDKQTLERIRGEASRNVMQLEATKLQVEQALAQSRRLYESLAKAERDYIPPEDIFTEQNNLDFIKSVKDAEAEVTSIPV